MNNHKAIIINGVARSGKDTFVQFCQDVIPHRHVYNLSTIAPIKELVSHIIESDDKNDKYRKLLSDVKLSLTEYNDYPYNWIIHQMNNKIQSNINGFTIFFIHCREPKEIEKFKTRLVNCSTLLITKPGISVPNNMADQNVERYVYDYIINNDKSLIDLKNQAALFCELQF